MVSEYKYSQVDFDKPLFLLEIEDILKDFIGCLLLYYPHIKSFGLNGNENILDYGCGK